ncbi:LLM class flavin-dependent oxidoreductase [Sphingobacterium alkalisoli]|uniref:LLM class flavin-dependent oxidoreductase n=1 Tax=Sphingobacterium alkalisoli TaxID=1874115 RepID=A0A4V5LYI0_9SPHI|nr:Atu2307/SP_0267 family LLM class monooxygenase [Sphingobacterium alkalisoli]TJY66619.1 LLM class flavin-dependent oxidoreductase [Sphingobacterium alkalisoli]GGH15289.1 luciferase [Sphingobacterium alkalisoli]
MEIGIDSFASAMYGSNTLNSVDAMEQLLERIVKADEAGLAVYGIGEHHKKEFLDSAPAVILAAAAARTKNIRLTSAVTVLSTSDPVRVYQSFATLDLISKGRAELVVGRGSAIEAYPLFGFDLKDYDALFKEKLELLLKVREQEFVTWSGKFRPALENQPVYPRSSQEKLPVWLGVGGTPESFVRAGTLGLPLMVAVIGGETARFRPLIDLYRQAGHRAGFAPEQLKVGLHSPGYVAMSNEEAIADYYPGYAELWTKLGRERGWPPVTRTGFNALIASNGVLVVGGPEQVAAKLLKHSEALGGVDRFTFQMDNAGLNHEQLLRSIEIIGSKVIPLVNKNLG